MQGPSRRLPNRESAMLTHLITTAIVSPDPAVHRHLQEALESSALTEAIWSLSHYPELPALERLREAPAGCIVFLDFSDPFSARPIAAELDRAYPFVSVVAVLHGGTKEDVIALMRLGVREVIGYPISSSEVAVAFVRASKKLNPAESAGGNIYAFLPARAGSGATTIAISTAASVARMWNQPTLLLDFDLRFGITSFLLKLDGRHSVQDALIGDTQLDEDFWMRLVSRRGTLDVLGSAPAELPPEPRPGGCTSVLNFAQSRYKGILVDLSGAMEPYEMETLHQAKEIFLTFTADMTGLHMAKRQAEALRRLQLIDKVSGLISQVEGRLPLPMGEIEKLLQVPVRFILPRDDKSINEAAMQGAAVRRDSKFGAQIEAVAKSIALGPVPELSKPVTTRRFLDFVYVNRSREHTPWKD